MVPHGINTKAVQGPSIYSLLPSRSAWAPRGLYSCLLGFTWLRECTKQGSEIALFTPLKVFVSLVLIGLGSVIIHKLSFTF